MMTWVSTQQNSLLKTLLFVAYWAFFTGLLTMFAINIGTCGMNYPVEESDIYFILYAVMMIKHKNIFLPVKVYLCFLTKNCQKPVNKLS